MPWTYPKLLRELDRKRVPRGAEEEFMRRKRDAYEFLLHAAQAEELNERQLGHTLRLLLRLRLFAEDRTEFYELLIRLSEDSRQFVRSNAIFGAFFLTEMAMQWPTAEKITARPQEVLALTRVALQSGVEKNHSDWLNTMMEKGWLQVRNNESRS